MQETALIKNPNAMSVTLCTGAAFLKKNSCPVTRIFLFDTAGLHLLTFLILEPYSSKDNELDLSHIISYDAIIVPSNLI